MPRTTGWADHKLSQSPEGQTLEYLSFIHICGQLRAGEMHKWVIVVKEQVTGLKSVTSPSFSPCEAKWASQCDAMTLMTQTDTWLFSHFNSLGLQGHRAQPSTFGSHCVRVELLQWHTQNNSIQQYQECHQVPKKCNYDLNWSMFSHRNCIKLTSLVCQIIFS